MMVKCSDENQAISLLIPTWFKAIGGLMCALLTAAIVGAAGWAYNMDRRVAEMSGELKSLNAITAERFATLKERLDRERREDERRRTGNN